MTDAQIRARAEAYIDEALTELDVTLSAEERESAIERVVAASRQLRVVSRESDREPVATPSS